MYYAMLILQQVPSETALGIPCALHHCSLFLCRQFQVCGVVVVAHDGEHSVLCP